MPPRSPCKHPTCYPISSSRPAHVIPAVCHTQGPVAAVGTPGVCCRPAWSGRFSVKQNTKTHLFVGLFCLFVPALLLLLAWLLWILRAARSWDRGSVPFPSPSVIAVGFGFNPREGSISDSPPGSSPGWQSCSCYTRLHENEPIQLKLVFKPVYLHQ